MSLSSKNPNISNLAAISQDISSNLIPSIPSNVSGSLLTNITTLPHDTLLTTAVTYLLSEQTLPPDDNMTLLGEVGMYQEFVQKNEVFSTYNHMDAPNNMSMYDQEQKLTESGYFVSSFFLLVISIFGIFNNLAVLVIMFLNKQASYLKFYTRIY